MKIKKSIENWENRILTIAGVNPCKCSNCDNMMRFYIFVVFADLSKIYLNYCKTII